MRDIRVRRRRITRKDEPMNDEGEKAGTTTSRLGGMTELERYGCGPIQFTGTNDALYERHLCLTT